VTDAATLLAAQAEGRAIVTEYGYAPRVRDFAATAGGKRILGMIERDKANTELWLSRMVESVPAFESIPLDGDPEGRDPFWNNGMIPGLDGMLLYALLSTVKPKTYFEVGSGNSTKFVAKAIRDHGLATRVISIDPHPRAVIDSLCDEVIRLPVEDVDLSKHLALLQPDDVVYIDNSHRSFQNSDVTVFFTEMLPALPAGVIYGVHDIFLPEDYPPEWLGRFYNEQYLLASYLLGGADGDTILFPGIHVSRTQVDRIASDLFASPALSGVSRHAGAFWMMKG